MSNRRGIPTIMLAITALVALGWGAATTVEAAPPGKGLDVKPTQAPPAPCKVTYAALTGSTRIYKGACPVTIKFVGIIQAKGTITANKPCTVKYVFTRSDGAEDTEVKTLTFTAPMDKPVSTTWQLGGPALPHYLGWQAIKILSPNPMESAHCDFEIFCKTP